MSYLPQRYPWMMALLMAALLTVMGPASAQDEPARDVQDQAQPAGKVHTNLPAAIKQAMASEKTLFITVSTSDADSQQALLENLFGSPEVVQKMMDHMIRVHVQKKTPQGLEEGRRTRRIIEMAKEQEKISYILLDVERGEMAVKFKQPMDVSALGTSLQQLYPFEKPDAAEGREGEAAGEQPNATEDETPETQE